MPTPWEFIFLIQERPLSPRSPAVSFEIAAATTVSVLKSGGRGVGVGAGRNHQSSHMQSSPRPFSLRLSKNDTN